MLKTVAVSVTPWRHSADARAGAYASAFPVRMRTNHPSAHVAAPADGRPHRRPLAGGLAASVVLALALTCTVTLTAPPRQAAASAGLDRTERSIVKLVNRYRARHGRGLVRASGRLNGAADRHSRDMLAHDFFGHSSRNGTAAATRVRRSSNARTVGENIAFVGFGQGGAARRVVGMWIASPPHRAVILNGSFRRIGVGRRSGYLGSRRGSTITADFASGR